jgi:N-acetylmannosamine-6-phosphate 2-epimerase / N-acetylmannosamine kinase
VTRALAIDIGGSKTLVALVEQGRVIGEKRFDTPREAGPFALCEAITSEARDWRGYECVGVAVTGLVVDGEWSAMNPATLAVPQGFPLGRTLSERLERPVACFNDAQAAAWGEYRFGAGRGQDLVFVTISTGVGGGVVIDGKLLIGRSGLAGSVGLTRPRGQNAPMFEEECAGQWFAAAGRRLGFDTDARGVFSAAAQGATWAAYLVGQSADRVAGLLANLQLLFDPPAIVLGGGIGLAAGYAEALRERLGRRAAVLRADLRLAELGHQAGLVGAADLALAASGR